MLKEGDTFFTSVGCMDGRVQEPVAEFGRQTFEAEFPDTVTEAGMVGLLANNPSQELLDSIRKKVHDVSMGKHASKGIVVHGHEECAGNLTREGLPVSEEIHKEHIMQACEAIKSLTGGRVDVIGVYVRKSGQSWVVEKVKNFSSDFIGASY